MQKFICNLIALVVMLFCNFLKAEELVNTRPQWGSIENRVKKRLCFAGRIKILDIDKRANMQRCRAKFLSQIASSNDHPNARKLGEVRIVRGNIPIKSGQVYCMIVTAGSKLGFTIVAYGNDTSKNLSLLTKLIKSSASFQNSNVWKKRRNLWRHFYQEVQPKKISVYCENDNLDKILYMQIEKKWPQLLIYNLGTGKSNRVLHAKVIAGVNRITYESKQFLVWYCGNIELYVSAN